jgi:hypothetical protein
LRYVIVLSKRVFHLLIKFVIEVLAQSADMRRLLRVMVSFLLESIHIIQRSELGIIGFSREDFLER